MTLFRRALRWLFFLFGLLVGIIGSVAVFFARRMISPPRQRLWATPADLGLVYEDVQFPARDGVRLSGWFVPAADPARRKGATVILVHGWPWNRLGNAAEDILASFSASAPVDLLRLAYGLHQDGFHLLMFDLRNHGESAAVPPVTFGQQEVQDLLGALAYVENRPETDSQRLAVLGFSMGANTLLYALPLAAQIKAAVAVQPVTISLFARRFALDMLGPLGLVVLPLAAWLYRLAGGPPLDTIRPLSAASQAAGETPVLFIQGKGDRWGSAEDVARIAAATPQARGPLFVETVDRFGGYQYAVNNPKVITAFFEQHLPE